MRKTMILTLGVLILSLAVCTLGRWYLGDILEQARHLRSTAILAVENDDAEHAKEIMVALAALWRDEETLMEILTDHDGLHEVKTGIIEAQICLECGDHDDFLRTISIVGEGLEHMNDTEALRFSNLY